MKQLFMVLLLGLSLCVPMQVHAQTYGPTAAKETLWSIAKRLRPTTDISTQQMMLALYKSNPHAFNRRNINSLKKGVYLQIPTLNQITRQSQVQAIREAQRQNQNWQTATGSTSAVASNKLSQLRAEIKRLTQQLQATRQKNRILTQQLKTLRQQQGSSRTSASAQKQIKNLRAEIADLKATLGEREDQIKTMRAALKNASESIKQQHAENKRIFEKLKAVSPESIPAQPATKGSPQLTLSALNINNSNAPQPTQQAQTTPNTQNTNANAKIWADEVQPTNTGDTNAVVKPPLTPQPVSQLVDDSRNRQLENEAHADTQSTSSPSPSKLSFIVALFSLIFILALLWRTFSQRRQARNEEAAIRREVEALERQNKDDKSSGNKDSDKKRQDPEIIF